VATLILAAPAVTVFSALWLLEQFHVLPDQEPLVRAMRNAALAVIAAAAVLSPAALADGVPRWIDHRLDKVMDPFVDTPPTSGR
jgi:hypothetical protein